jgi:hypothetical protein
VARRKGSAREQEKDAVEAQFVASIRRSLVDSEKRGLVTIRPDPSAAETTARNVVRYLWADGFNVVRRPR